MIKYLEKTYGKCANTEDVTVSFSNSTGGLRFSFSPEAGEKVFGDCQYFVVGYDEETPDILFLAKATRHNGIKLQRWSYKGRLTAEYTAIKYIPDFKKFIGNYSLQYDENTEVYFIEAKENEQ